MIMMCRAAPDGRVAGATAGKPEVETVVAGLMVVVCAVAGAGDDVGASTV
jgi:hypothetical protein